MAPVRRASRLTLPARAALRSALAECNPQGCVYLWRPLYGAAREALVGYLFRHGLVRCNPVGPPARHEIGLITERGRAALRSGTI